MIMSDFIQDLGLKCSAWKAFGSKILVGQLYTKLALFGSEKILSPKKFWVFVFKNFFGSKKRLLFQKKFLVPK